MQKESYNPNQIGNHNNFPIPDNNNYNNISPQNNYMFTSDQRIGNFSNTNQVKNNNQLGNYLFLIL